jgi:hypothetical protein
MGLYLFNRGFTIEVDGIPVGPSSILIAAGLPFILQYVVEVTSSPVTVEIVATGLAVSLARGESASIMTTKVAE